MELVFEWDPRKGRANQRKHRISFSEPTSVFSNPPARIFADESHSAGEQREIIIGHSQTKRLLLVCFIEPEEGRVRIISARRELHDHEDHVTPQNETEAVQRTSALVSVRLHTGETKNRFAGRLRTGSLAVLLDPDVARVFRNAESVNSVLRALLTTMPARPISGPR